MSYCTYTATTTIIPVLLGRGRTPKEALDHLREQVDRFVDTADMVDMVDESLTGSALEKSRREYRQKAMRQSGVRLYLDDIGGWDDDQYFAGTGKSRLATANVTVGRRRWVIESRTSAEGTTTVTAYPLASAQLAAARSVQAGGGYRGLCAEHIDGDQTIDVPAGADLLRVLGAA